MIADEKYGLKQLLISCRQSAVAQLERCTRQLAISRKKQEDLQDQLQAKEEQLLRLLKKEEKSRHKVVALEQAAGVSICSRLDMENTS